MTEAAVLKSGAAPPSASERRRERLLEAAEEIFLSVGFAEASMAEVVRRAGGSKATLYKYFGDKEGLFAAVIERYSARMLAQALSDANALADDPEAFLTAFGQTVTAFLLQPECILVARSLMADGARFPGLVSAFERAGSARMQAVLRPLFERWTAAGLIRTDDPAASARIFFEMTAPSLTHRVLMNGQPLQTRAEQRDHIRRVVAIFLYGVSGGARPVSG